MRELKCVGVKSGQKEDREIGKVGQNDGGREKVK